MKKLSASKLKQLEVEWHRHNRWLKQNHMSKQTFDEYVDGVFGRVRVDRRTHQAPNRLPEYGNYRGSENKYSSADVAQARPDATARKESPAYTGTLVKAISTMHKSNAVPVIDQKELEEHARMRR
jgi:hypothetical protein